MPTAIQPAEQKGKSSLWPLLIFVLLSLAAIAGAMEAYRRYKRARAG
jgi:hypothetical protein